MRETSNRQFTQTESAVISLLACSLFGAPFTEPTDAEPDLILEEAEKQAVFPLVYQTLSQNTAGALDPKWKLKFHRHIAHNVNVIYQHHQAHDLMTEAGIPYTVIKGCASGAYYPVLELRTMGDVDLYVGKPSMEAVRAVLTEKGFAVSGLTHSHHWTFTRGNEVYEVHWLPSGVPAEDGGRIRGQFDDLLEKRCLAETGGSAMYLPDVYHHGLILLLHTANHLSAGGIGLRHLMDWLVFVSSMPEQEFRGLFEGPLQQLGLWQFARVLTAVGVCCFSCPSREFCADVSPELAKSILADVFDGGNFGVKDSRRLMQSKLLRDEKTREIDGKSSFRHILRFMNRKAYLELPSSEKHPILLPVGWVKAGIRHHRENKDKKRTNKQPVKLRSLAQSAKEREQLYRQLRLFEE